MTRKNSLDLVLRPGLKVEFVIAPVFHGVAMDAEPKSDRCRILIVFFPGKIEFPCE